MIQRKVLSLFLLVICYYIVASDAESIFTNAYAKVAKWGSSLNLDGPIKGNEEGRSNGQSFFTQSSDVHLRSGQNLKDNKEKVVYHYSMPAQSITSRVDSSQKMSGFQDRFNPPPAFQFADSSKKDIPHEDQDHNHDHNHDHNQNQGPVYVPPKTASYDSPISSYNPIASGLPDSGRFPSGGTKYPPFNQDSSNPVTGPAGPSASPSKLKGPISSDYDNSDGYQYIPPASGFPGPSAAPPMLPTPVPPSAPSPSKPLPTLPITNNHKFPSYVYDHIPADYDDPHHDHNHDYIPPSSDQSQDTQDSQDSQGSQGPSGPASNPSAPQNSPPQDYSDSDYPQDHDHHHKPSMDDLPEYLDHDPGHQSKFNNFPLWSNFYDDHHDHHPVYHPITTTTPKPPPPPKMEDENRVNKGHYSYYYLGRKLYYVPLYFSVYFIIYITVLILKSIARHKVNFAHELDNVSKARSLDIDAGVVNSTVVDEVEENTTRAIMQFKRRFIAM